MQKPTLKVSDEHIADFFMLLTTKRKFKKKKTIIALKKITFLYSISIQMTVLMLHFGICMPQAKIKYSFKIELQINEMRKSFTFTFQNFKALFLWRKWKRNQKKVTTTVTSTN